MSAILELLRTSEDADFPKVLKKGAHPGEGAEKSIDVQKVLKKRARAAEISVTNLNKSWILASVRVIEHIYYYDYLL